MTEFDLMFVVDSTASMGDYLMSLRACLPQVCELARVVQEVQDVGIMAFWDYDRGEVVKWSGWHAETQPLSVFATSLSPEGGGDAPEAVKTALNRALEVMRRPTLVVLYTDNGPHCAHMGSQDFAARETQAVATFDWVDLARQLRDRGAMVFSLLPNQVPQRMCWYSLMAEWTNGAALSLEWGTTPDKIMQRTVGLFLAWMGEPYEAVRVRADTWQSATSEQQAPDLLPPSAPQLRVENWHGERLMMSSPLASMKDPAYRARVQEVFRRLLKPELVHCLSSNRVLGKLWRAICRDRADPAREALVGMLGDAVNRMSSAAQQAEMRQFLDESYDQTGELHSLFDGAQGPRLALRAPGTMTRGEVLEIARSCQPSVVSRLAWFLARIQEVPEAHEDERAVPCSLPPMSLFGALPHLISPGVMFSRRCALLLACVALDAPILAGAARSVLTESRGQWLDFSLPENCSASVARLLLRHPELLTEAEVTRLTATRTRASLHANLRAPLRVRTGYSSSLTRRPTDTGTCRACRNVRPLPLLTERACAVCVTFGPEPALPGDALWCECSTCEVQYPVVHPERLRVRAKCHFCREGRPCPSFRCDSCENLIMHQRGPAPRRCGACARPEGQTTFEHEEEMGIFLRSNFGRADALPDHAALLRATYKGKQVLNCQEVLQQLQDLSRETSAAPCLLCYEDVPPAALGAACGRKACSIKCCADCLSKWYGVMQPGSLYAPAHLHCPFCKNSPAHKVLARHGPRALRLRPPEEVDPAYYHAWCTRCDHVRPARARACTDDVPELHGFVCEDCAAVPVPGETRPAPEFKECPWCSAMTERMSGCGHLVCECGGTWCWVCGAKSTEIDIYRHLSSEHGGFGYAEGDGHYYDSESDYE